MEQLQELFAQIESSFEQLKTEHETFIVKGNKSAAGRARKAAQALKAVVTPYKKASVELTKK
jgi:hypothetical protein